MSFWGKKTDDQAALSEAIAIGTAVLREKIADFEIRLSTMENSSNKREKLSFQELKQRTDEIAESTDTRLKSFEERIRSLETKPTPFAEEIETQHAEIEKILKMQTTLEEKIAVYDEKLLKLKELTERLETQIQALETKPKPSSAVLSGFPIRASATGPSGPSGPPAPSTSKTPSWVKAKPKLEITIPTTPDA